MKKEIFMSEEEHYIYYSLMFWLMFGFQTGQGEERYYKEKKGFIDNGWLNKETINQMEKKILSSKEISQCLKAVKTT